MRIQSQEPFDFLLADLEAPGLGPREEEPLGTGESIDHRRLLAVQRNQVGLPGNRETAEVSDVLTDGQCTIDVQFGGQLGCERVELIDQRLRALFESGAVRRFPPIGEFPRSVELRTLVVETMADLVTDHRADGAVVGGLVALRVEEGRLEDRGREDDLIESGVVVGVDHLGRHEPLVAIDRRTDLRQISLELELRSRTNVGENIIRVDPQCRIVAPPHRVTDLRRERVEFLEGPTTRRLPHPLQIGDALSVRLDEVRDEFIHTRLHFGRVVAFHVDLANRFTHGAFDEGNATLPSRANRFGAGERATVEIEVLVDELRGEERRVSGDDLPRQPVLPDGKVRVREESADGARETWLAKDNVVERSNGRLQGVVPHLEAHFAKKFRRLGPRLQVVRLFAVTRVDVVPVTGGNLRLQFKDSSRARRGVTHAGQFEHALHVHDEGVANRREVFFAVVALIGKRESALFEQHDVTLGVTRVVVNEDRVEATNATTLKPADEGQQFVDRLQRIDLRETIDELARAAGVDPLLFEEARVQIADLSGLAALRRGTCLVENFADRQFGDVGQYVERAVASLVLGHGGSFDPLTVHVLVEIVLGSYGLGEISEVKAGCHWLRCHPRKPNERIQLRLQTSLRSVACKFVSISSKCTPAHVNAMCSCFLVSPHDGQYRSADKEAIHRATSNFFQNAFLYQLCNSLIRRFERSSGHCPSDRDIDDGIANKRLRNIDGSSSHPGFVESCQRLLLEFLQRNNC